MYEETMSTTTTMMNILRSVVAASSSSNQTTSAASTSAESPPLDGGGGGEDCHLSFVDQIVATIILVLFFVIGTLSNLSFISIYLHKQRRRCGGAVPCSNVMRNGRVSTNGVSIRSTCIRIKNQVSNKAIFTLSMSNLLLSSLFIPYTILFRVWNYNSTQLVFLVLEHLKDNLLYMNLLIIMILSIERYVAVCKPKHYKKLESNINKIIWLVFLIGFVLSSSNYFIEKSDLACSASLFTTTSKLKSSSTSKSANNTSSSSSNVYEATFSINLNLLTSGILFSLSACISTFFYVQIAWHHITRAKQLKKKNAAPGEYKKVSIANSKDSENMRMSDNKHRCSSTTREEEETTNNNNAGDERSTSLVREGSRRVADTTTSVVSTCGEKSECVVSCDATTNQGDNDESDLSKSKSDASVQTDFVLRKNKKIVKKKYSNIFATNLITKISIWLSVIIWVSILPFMLSVFKIVPYYRFFYFLYYIENVFSPLVYICLNKRYRNYLKRIFTLKIKK